MTASRPFSRGLSVIALALVASLAVAGCDHLTEPDGPNLTDRFGDFAILDSLMASQATVDFAGGEVITFEARFNKQVAWVIEITGAESGAVKRIEGFSSDITAENARWSGGTTDLPLFKDEAISAALFVPSEASDTSRAAVDVVTPRVYPGNVFEDFEGDTEIFFGNFEFEFDLALTGIRDDPAAGEGDLFYQFISTGGPTVADAFFIGLIDIRPEGRGVFEVPTTVPDDLYFNFLVRGYEGIPNTIAVIQLIVDGNGTGAYEIDRDIALGFGDIPIDFAGWRLFSKPVSELGVTQAQAAAIVGVRVVVISDNNAQPNPPLPVAFGLDYITFTAGGPFQP